MTRRMHSIWALVCWFFLFLTAETTAAVQVSLFTAADSQTQSEIGQDIKRFIATPADVRLGSIKALGPADTLLNLQKEPGWSLAILPVDALVAYASLAERGNADANQLLSPVRVIAPLFSSEIYFIVRQDSELFSFNDIQNARINIGLPASTTAVSVGNIYRRLFGQSIPDEKLSTLKHEEALISLITRKGVDVVAIVGDQPLKLLADMKPEARQYIRLLKFDASHPSSKEVLDFYSPATISSESYPNLLLEDHGSIAVTQYLVAHRRVADADPSMRKFIRSWCTNSGRMKAEGSEKWRRHATRAEQTLPLKLSSVDFGVCEKDFSLYRQPDCTQELRVLGLCR